ncbi:MAG: N-formylglutamate amidohydrolase [Alphaproteobacteria bacterium]
MDRPMADADPRPLLDDDEPAPYEIVNLDGPSRVILNCDHASRRIPRRLGTLGVAPADLERHIAWDIGATAVARRLSEILDAPLILCGYSRLVVDCNRQLDQADAFVTQSEDVRVTGNEAMTAAARDARAEAVFWPYHDAVNRIVSARTAGEATPVMVSVHSFTPVYHGASRPWDIGVLHRWDRRLADLMMTALRGGELVVGDNQPYRVALDEDYTIPVHAETRGMPYALLEIRQDLVATDAGAEDWAERLASALDDVLNDPSVGDYTTPAPDIREPRFE